MWSILVSSPDLMGFLVLYVMTLLAGVSSAVLTRDRQKPSGRDCPRSPLRGQSFLYSGPLWSRPSLDARLLSVQHCCSTVYARMFSEVGQKIRLPSRSNPGFREAP
jgi:hypothetical protein